MNPLAVGAVAGTVAVMAAPAAFVLLLAPASSQGACAPGGAGGAATELAANEVPGDLMRLYRDAEDRYGVPWNVLAAINRVETDFGRNMAVSSAGAQGWMQFMPATWTLYGVDGDGDGRRDPENPRDAIPAAARYLKASGAPADLRAAVFAYNHASWYVDDVLTLAARYGTNPVVGEPVLNGGCAAPGGPVLERLVAEADRMTSLDQPYLWGGGHAGFDADGPWDCSGAISQLLHAVGLLDGTPLTSTGLMAWGQPGRGRDWTLYANAEHVFLIVERGEHAGQAWGTATRDLAGKPGSGPMWHRHTTAGFTARHIDPPTEGDT